MTRVHPQFLMNGMKKAMETQDFDEFNKELAKGMNYWTNTLNTEIGPLDPNEVPLIITALRELADTYEKVVPGSGKIADTFHGNVNAERQLMDGEIFTIRARRCKRCGRLLTSAEAVEKGYGCQCAAKAQAEEDEKKPIPGQMTFDDLFKNMEE